MDVGARSNRPSTARKSKNASGKMVSIAGAAGTLTAVGTVAVRVVRNREIATVGTAMGMGVVAAVMDVMMAAATVIAVVTEIEPKYPIC